MTPQALIDEAQCCSAGFLSSRDAAATLRASAHRVTAGFVTLDLWRVGGDLNVDEAGQLRLQGRNANYPVQLQVTGRLLRYDIFDAAPAVRVRVHFENPEGPVTVPGWLRV